MLAFFGSSLLGKNRQPKKDTVTNFLTSKSWCNARFLASPETEILSVGGGACVRDHIGSMFLPSLAFNYTFKMSHPRCYRRQAALRRPIFGLHVTSACVELHVSLGRAHVTRLLFMITSNTLNSQSVRPW